MFRAKTRSSVFYTSVSTHCKLWAKCDNALNYFFVPNFFEVITKIQLTEFEGNSNFHFSCLVENLQLTEAKTYLSNLSIGDISKDNCQRPIESRGDKNKLGPIQKHTIKSLRRKKFHTGAKREISFIKGKKEVLFLNSGKTWRQWSWFCILVIFGIVWVN